jgi:hypothetical protein
VFDIPHALRDTKPDAYSPQHFAVGPYHQSCTDLKDMERYKLAAAKRTERLFADDHKIPDLVYRFPKSTRSNYFILLPHGMCLFTMNSIKLNM